MLIHIPAVLTPDEVRACRAALDAGRWIDGRGSAGRMAASAKDNQEADLTDPAVRARSDFILRALSSNAAFTASALPARICPLPSIAIAAGRITEPTMMRRCCAFLKT